MMWAGRTTPCTPQDGEALPSQTPLPLPPPARATPHSSSQQLPRRLLQATARVAGPDPQPAPQPSPQPGPRSAPNGSGTAEPDVHAHPEEGLAGDSGATSSGSEDGDDGVEDDVDGDDGSEDGDDGSEDGDDGSEDGDDGVEADREWRGVWRGGPGGACGWLAATVRGWVGWGARCAATLLWLRVGPGLHNSRRRGAPGAVAGPLKSFCHYVC
jgi:hypothetical protein